MASAFKLLLLYKHMNTTPHCSFPSSSSFLEAHAVYLFRSSIAHIRCEKIWHLPSLPTQFLALSGSSDF